MPLVEHYLADLQSVQELRCYGNIAPNAKCQRVLELALCLVINVLNCFKSILLCRLVCLPETIHQYIYPGRIWECLEFRPFGLQKFQGATFPQCFADTRASLDSRKRKSTEVQTPKPRPTYASNRAPRLQIRRRGQVFLYASPLLVVVTCDRMSVVTL